MRAIWSFVKEIVIVLTIALILSSIVRAFFFQAFYVPSASMEDTLQLQDRIIASKFSKIYSPVDRGDVIVFRDPGGWLPDSQGSSNPVVRALIFVGLLPSDEGKDLVKRVIAKGGDEVICCDDAGRIIVNGVPLEEDYLKSGVSSDQVEFEITVPEGRLFMLGDNRPNSRDSRYHLQIAYGTIPESHVVGKVNYRIWPFDRFAKLNTPEIFSQIPDNN
ncbi:MAG: signal peptidase I [Candidatus Nanopelagicales bacterium]